MIAGLLPVLIVALAELQTKKRKGAVLQNAILAGVAVLTIIIMIYLTAVVPSYLPTSGLDNETLTRIENAKNTAFTVYDLNLFALIVMAFVTVIGVLLMLGGRRD